jgi:hypothetical protein
VGLLLHDLEPGLQVGLQVLGRLLVREGQHVLDELGDEGAGQTGCSGSERVADPPILLLAKR